MTGTAKVVKVCTHDWFDIVTRNGELALNVVWEGDGFVRRKRTAEREGVMRAAGMDADCYRGWVATVEGVDDRHSAVKVGDYCCCRGVGADVTFVRPGV